MNILFVRMLREYCFFCYCFMQNLTHSSDSSAVSLKCFYGPKEMVTPGQKDHFLSFCCGRCLRNHIKHLVRKSDVWGRYNFFHFTFCSLVMLHISSFETKIMSYLEFRHDTLISFLRLSVLSIRLI